MTVVLWICFGMLVLAAVLTVARIVRGPSLLDRMIASDVLLVIICSGLLLNMVRTGVFLNLVFILIVALIGFLGSVTVARTVAANPKE